MVVETPLFLVLFILAGSGVLADIFGAFQFSGGATISFQATRLGVVMVSSQSNVAAHCALPLLLYKISVLLDYVKLRDYVRQVILHFLQHLSLQHFCAST